jgi:hypothetical protein
LLLIILPAYSCNSQNSKKVEYKIYKNEGIGWTNKFLSSFREMTVEEIGVIEGQGQTAFE